MDIEEIRERCQSLLAELNEEFYLASAGLKDEPEIAAIYGRHAELTARRPLEIVRQAWPGAERPPRRLRYLREFLISILEMHSYKEIVDQVFAIEAQAMIEANGSAPVSFRQSTILVQNEPDRARREAIVRARRPVFLELRPLQAEAIRAVGRLAKELEFQHYVDLRQQASEIDLRRLAEEVCRFLELTDELYETVADKLLREHLGIRLAEAGHHDMAFLTRVQEMDEYFPADTLVSTIERSVGEMGLELTAGGNIQLDLEPRPNKAPRAFCAPINVPNRVMLVLNPTGGEQDYTTFLHELGHSLHYAHVDPDQPFEFKYLGDYSVTEGYAFLLDHLTSDPAWLARYTPVPNPQGFAREAAFRNLYLARRYAAQINYELELYSLDDPLKASDRFCHWMRRGTGLAFPPETDLYSVDAEFYCARYLRAWLLQARLSTFLADQYGAEWFRRPEVGEFLKRLWKDGQKYRVREICEYHIKLPLTVEPLAQRFFERLSDVCPM